MSRSVYVFSLFWHLTGDTRPLSIVNCDNRVVASAMRLRWEALLDRYTKSRQQGFLKGRSILKRLINLENEMVLSALHEQIRNRTIETLKSLKKENFRKISKIFVILSNNSNPFCTKFSPNALIGKNLKAHIVFCCCCFYFRAFCLFSWSHCE